MHNTTQKSKTKTTFLVRQHVTLPVSGFNFPYNITGLIPGSALPPQKSRLRTTLFLGLGVQAEGVPAKGQELKLEKTLKK